MSFASQGKKSILFRSNDMNTEIVIDRVECACRVPSSTYFSFFFFYFLMCLDKNQNLTKNIFHSTNDDTINVRQ